MKNSRTTTAHGVRGMILLAALACLVVSAQASDASAPIPFRVMAKVWVDANGQPSQVRAMNALPQAVSASIEERVAMWRFQSPVVDGTPRSGITYVSLGACAVPEPDGSLRLALKYTGNGPGYADGVVALPPPRYPIDMARRGLGGEWKVNYVVELDGSATLVGIAESQPDPRTLKLVEPALRAWVKSMRHLPEQIDGVPVRTRVSTPVSMMVVKRASSGKALFARQKRRLEGSPECAAVMEQGGDQRPFALDSPFRRLDAG